MPTTVMVKWNKHHDSCDYSFRLADTISLLSWALLIQMERQEDCEWTGIAGEAKGIGQGC